MSKFINNWYNISVYLAGVSTLLIILLPVDTTTQLLLGSIALLFLHFFEEFGVPGGFPWLGMKVLMKSPETDKSKWPCNNLNSLFGNWGFLIFIYILPIIFSEIRFLVLSAILFLLAELFMHCLIFPLRLIKLYNPGQMTSLGLGALGVFYFAKVFDPLNFVWYDYLLAVLWFCGVFYFCFRSKLYLKLGLRAGYELTDQTAYGPFRQKCS